MNARHITQEIRELGKTNEGNGIPVTFWNLNVQTQFNEMGCKDEKVSMTLKQWHKKKYERGERKKRIQNN